MRGSAKMTRVTANVTLPDLIRILNIPNPLRYKCDCSDGPARVLTGQIVESCMNGDSFAKSFPDEKVGWETYHKIREHMRETRCATCLTVLREGTNIIPVTMIHREGVFVATVRDRSGAMVAGGGERAGKAMGDLAEQMDMRGMLWPKQWQGGEKG